MPYLTDLADAVRRSGLPVVEVAGWRSRGHGPMTSVKGTVCHWTATPDTTRPGEDYPSLTIVRDGRAGLPGPLCNLGLGRGGTVYVVAAGLAYHAGAGYWPGIGSTGNANLIGIEAEEGGDGSWTVAMLDAYPRLCAALTVHYGYPLDRNIGHHEWAPGRKPDISRWPGDMPAFRATVHQRLTSPAPDPGDNEEDNTVKFVCGDSQAPRPEGGVFGDVVFKVVWPARGPIAVRTRVPNPNDPGYQAALLTGEGMNPATGGPFRLPQAVVDAIPDAN